MWWGATIIPSLAISTDAAAWLGVFLAIAGATVCLAGVYRFRLARTTVDPRQPGRTSAFVTGGIYGWSRNPMYLGFLLLLLGWGAYIASPVAILIAITFVPYMNRFQIVPEERMLLSMFGDTFVAYANRVRRWI